MLKDTFFLKNSIYFTNIFKKFIFLIGHHCRVVFLTILVFGCLTHWHWKASLISHLSVVLPFKPFTSMEELLSSPYDITLTSDGAEKMDFELSKSGIFKDLWLSKFNNKEKSLNKLKQERTNLAVNSIFTYYINDKSAKNLKEYGDCKLEIMDFSAKKILFGFPFPKNSQYKALFNSKLQKMFESGELQIIKEKHSKETPDCQVTKGMPLGFENIAIIFLIISLGVFASLLFYGFEQIFSRIKTGRENIQLY